MIAVSSSKTITMEKVYRKLENLEKGLAELRYAILPAEKLSKKELRELSKTSEEMKNGKFLTSEEAISILGK